MISQLSHQQVLKYGKFISVGEASMAQFKHVVTDFSILIR